MRNSDKQFRYSTVLTCWKRRYIQKGFYSNKQITADRNIILYGKTQVYQISGIYFSKCALLLSSPKQEYVVACTIHVNLSYVKSGKTRTAFMVWENTISKIFQLIKYCIIVYVYVLWIKLQHVVHWWQKYADSKLSTDMKANCIVWFSSPICEWVLIVSLSLGIKFH